MGKPGSRGLEAIGAYTAGDAGIDGARRRRRRGAALAPGAGVGGVALPGLVIIGKVIGKLGAGAGAIGAGDIGSRAVVVTNGANVGALGVELGAMPVSGV